MASEAVLFIENGVNNFEMHNNIRLTEETLRNVLENELISVSDYQLFRFLCNWAEYEQVEDAKLVDIAKECIDFSTFSLSQLRRAQLDCPSLSTDILLNPFIRSKILSEVESKDVIPDCRDHYLRYSLVFRACAEDLSWDILNNVLTSALAKILVFKFLIGDVEWICVLDMPQQLQSRETLEVTTIEHQSTKAFLCIRQDEAISKRFTLDSTYSVFLSDQRLQIYQGTKSRTFISFNVNDANDLSVVSIDLGRFDKRLSNRLGGVRIRKEAFLDLEVYCLDPYGEPISKIHFAEFPTAVAPTAKNQLSTGERFQHVDEDFPQLGDKYGGVYLEADKELHRLYDLHNSNLLTSKDFQTFSTLLGRMNDSLVSIL